MTISISTAPDGAGAVFALVDSATDADGVTPVSEHVLLHLRYGGDQRAHDLYAHRDGAGAGPVHLAGYAHLDASDQERGPAAELAVHPAFRRQGVASALVAELERISDRVDPEGRLRLWAHGRHPGAIALARSRGYVADRVLWQMRRSLRPALPAPVMPPGIAIRPFRVGRDEAAWTQVNNAAFAAHPDQGGWTVQDVRLREREPWFDPQGFLLAERIDDGAVVGFHWTKVHAGTERAGSGDRTDGSGTDGGGTDGGGEPIGEVYVLGVDPAAQSMGLGQVLTLAGLRYLRSAGLSQVMLYVEESNAPAIAVYTRLGFARWNTDVQYRRPGSGGGGTASNVRE